jgi:hypothetical protein
MMVYHRGYYIVSLQLNTCLESFQKIKIIKINKTKLTMNERRSTSYKQASKVCCEIEEVIKLIIIIIRNKHKRCLHTLNRFVISVVI